MTAHGRSRLGRMVPLAGLAGRTAGEAVVAALRKWLTGEDSAEFHERTSERYATLVPPGAAAHLPGGDGPSTG